MTWLTLMYGQNVMHCIDNGRLHTRTRKVFSRLLRFTSSFLKQRGESQRNQESSGRLKKKLRVTTRLRGCRQHRPQHLQDQDRPRRHPLAGNLSDLLSNSSRRAVPHRPFSTDLQRIRKARVNHSVSKRRKVKCSRQLHPPMSQARTSSTR